MYSTSTTTSRQSRARTKSAPSVIYTPRTAQLGGEPPPYDELRESIAGMHAEADTMPGFARDGSRIFELAADGCGNVALHRGHLATVERHAVILPCCNLP